MMEYIISDKKNYNKKLSCKYEEYLAAYKKITLMYFHHYNTIATTDNINKKIIDVGITSLTNIFLMLLITCKNLNLTLQNCEKTIFYYFEFIDQMNKPKTEIQSILKLTVYDAKIFIYKKTIYELLNVKKNNSVEEEEIFKNLKNYTLGVLHLLEVYNNNNNTVTANDLRDKNIELNEILPSIISDEQLYEIYTMNNNFNKEDIMNLFS